MKNIEQQLIHSRPSGSVSNEAFVKRALKAVKQARNRETFALLARKLGVNQQKEHTMTKLFSTPKFTAVAISAAIVTSGAAYAALNWFGSTTQSTQQANGVHVTTTDCSPSLVQALKTNQKQTNTSDYVIVKPNLVTKADIEQHELANCEKRAIEDSVRQKLPQIFEAGDAHNGLYYPVGAYGTVTAVSGTRVTISGIPVDHQFGNREYITASLALSPETLVTDKGAPVDVASFRPGDRVYFIFQNEVSPTQNDNDRRHMPSAASTVRAVAKTQYDIKTITEKMERAAAEGAFQVNNKSDAFGG